jgi:hypothetical protein
LEQTTTPELREIAKRYGVPFARKDSRMRLMRRIVFKIHAKNLEAGARPPAASKNRPATPNIKMKIQVTTSDGQTSSSAGVAINDGCRARSGTVKRGAKENANFPPCVPRHVLL